MLLLLLFLVEEEAGGEQGLITLIISMLTSQHEHLR